MLYIFFCNLVCFHSLVHSGFRGDHGLLAVQPAVLEEEVVAVYASVETQEIKVALEMMKKTTAALIE